MTNNAPAHGKVDAKSTSVKYTKNQVNKRVQPGIRGNTISQSQLVAQTILQTGLFDVGRQPCYKIYSLIGIGLKNRAESASTIYFQWSEYFCVFYETFQSIPMTRSAFT